MKDLSLKVLWFEKILIYLKRLSRVKELIIKSESDEKEKWLYLKSKNLLYPLLLSCYVLKLIFNIIIIMIALSNWILNDSNFSAITTWCFVIINFANVMIMMMLL